MADIEDKDFTRGGDYLVVVVVDGDGGRGATTGARETRTRFKPPRPASTGGC